MTDTESPHIPGVVRGQLTPIGDARGSFMELWRASTTDPAGATFSQANLSRSQAGVLRGMHFHDRQLDLWIVLSGRASVALVDLRPRIAGGSDAPPTEHFELGPGGSVLIPKRVAHGFLAIEALELLYLVTNEYDGSDEHGFAWSDVTVGLSWPVPDPIVSGRDASNPSLEAAVKAARQRDAAVPAR
ncbi:MAG: dTDP-4-dehydrorhamnose 3,5-epimerase family protein [Chloroflexi bacterium]|nr:dTDP-4-dehydrorhamnose 3,5-epimerase family protein [Chloroflexota bacterium]